MSKRRLPKLGKPQAPKTSKAVESVSEEILGAHPISKYDDDDLLLKIDAHGDEPPIRIYGADISTIMWRYKKREPDMQILLDHFKRRYEAKWGKRVAFPNQTFQSLSGDELLIEAVSGHSIYRFALFFADEIGKIICNKKSKESTDVAMAGMVAGVAAWIVQHFGMTVDIAQTIATAVLVAIMAATKGAFCKMAMEDIKEAIKAEALGKGKRYMHSKPTDTKTHRKIRPAQ